MNGALTIFSSDHAPTNYYDKDGKQVSRIEGNPRGKALLGPSPAYINACLAP
jgi:hypothetical protein